MQAAALGLLECCAARIDAAGDVMEGGVIYGDVMEAAGGIDALECLCYSAAARPDLAARAAALVDRFFGDPGEG